MICEPSADHLVWLDGELVPWPSASMHVSDHHYGVGVFEGVRAYENDAGAAIFRLHDHTARLFHSAHIMKIAIPERFGRDALNRAQVELMRRNGLRDAYLRPFVFHAGSMGIAPRTRGLRVHVAIMAFEWRNDGAFEHGDTVKQGIALRTSTFIRQHGSTLLGKAKANANYIGGILAREEAQDCGADDALLLDRDGFITETSGANLFVVRRGTLHTPPLESVLEGVTRDTVMALARKENLTVIERRMTRDDVYVSDEAFVTGTAAELTPVRELDGRLIGNGSRGEITARLQAAYLNLVRARSDSLRDWLTQI